MARAVSGALVLGGAVVAVLAPAYNGQWMAGLLAILVGMAGLYVTAEVDDD